MKPRWLSRLGWNKGKTVVPHAATNHNRQRDRRWEPRGGLSRDHVVGHEWRSVFQHEVTSSSASVPLNVEWPKASNGVNRNFMDPKRFSSFFASQVA
jgi:hypothetical protein